MVVDVLGRGRGAMPRNAAAADDVDTRTRSHALRVALQVLVDLNLVHLLTQLTTPL